MQDDDGGQRALFEMIEREQQWSESLWKSVVVKSIRMGWPAGLRRAQAAIGASKVKQVLSVQVFEDIWPAVCEIKDVYAELENCEWGALCARETHHGRGMTGVLLELIPEADQYAETPFGQAKMYEQAKAMGVTRFQPRAMPCFRAWQQMELVDDGQTREVDETPWTGMILAAADGHTKEGCQRRTFKTIISGHPDCHLRLCKLVLAHGWEHVRTQVHAQHLT